MPNIIPQDFPRYKMLIEPTFLALQSLGNSGTNEEIYNKVAEIMNLSDEIVDISHNGNSSLSELEYQLAWARTYLKNYGAIERSKRSVWTISQKFSNISSVEAKTVIKQANLVAKSKTVKSPSLEDNDSNRITDELSDVSIDSPEEDTIWRVNLAKLLGEMNPFAFERLSQLLLRECGFSQVEVTKKSGDGGIDGTGKLKINGIFSFNVAFQCKRYKGVVAAEDIRSFRGSLATNIEKGVMITTGTFSKAAKSEASDQGKQQIDLIDGEEFITKLAEYGLGVKEVRSIVIDDEYFRKI